MDDNPNTAVLDEEDAIHDDPDEDLDAELADDDDDDQDDSDIEPAADDQPGADDDLPPDPETLAQQLGAIQDAQDEADEAASDYLSAKKTATDLKKVWEAKVETVQALVRRSKEREHAPLFNGVQAKQEADATKAAEPQQEDESWKLIPLAEALPGLRKSVLQKLHDAQLTTMGELANWTAEDGGRKRLTDIAGVGEIAAQQIEQAQMDFWSKRANLPAEPKDEPGDDFKFATEADEE